MKKILVAVCLSFPLFAVAGTPQNPTVFKGTIADVESFEPIRNVEVELISTDESVKKTIMTNEEGKFSFENIPNGIYKVNITTKGYESYSRSVVVEDGQSKNMGFTLFKK